MVGVSNREWNSRCQGYELGLKLVSRFQPLIAGIYRTTLRMFEGSCKGYTMRKLEKPRSGGGGGGVVVVHCCAHFVQDLL